MQTYTDEWTEISRNITSNLHCLFYTTSPHLYHCLMISLSIIVLSSQFWFVDEDSVYSNSSILKAAQPYSDNSINQPPVTYIYFHFHCAIIPCLGFKVLLSPHQFEHLYSPSSWFLKISDIRVQPFHKRRTRVKTHWTRTLNLNRGYGSTKIKTRSKDLFSGMEAASSVRHCPCWHRRGSL